jgi:hypothetical protein
VKSKTARLKLLRQFLLWGNTDQRLRWKKFASDSLASLITFFAIIFVFGFII